MKNIVAAFICLMTITIGAKAQNSKPEFLKGPVSWEFERFALPQPKSHPIWQQLYEVQKDFTVTSTAYPQ
jgi:hypothetical protein